MRTIQKDDFLVDRNLLSIKDVTRLAQLALQEDNLVVWSFLRAHDHIVFASASNMNEVKIFDEAVISGRSVPGSRNST